MEVTLEQKLNMMVGKYQQKLADVQLQNTQLEVDNDILQQQVLLLQSELQQYQERDKDVEPDEGPENGYADEKLAESEAEVAKWSPDRDVAGPGPEDEFVTVDGDTVPDLSTVEEVAAKHTS